MQNNQCGSTPEMRLLEKALIEKSNISDKQATILLPLAIERKNYELAEMLVKKGTDITVISKHIPALLQELLKIQKTNMEQLMPIGEMASKLDPRGIPENPMLEPHQAIDRIIKNLRKQDKCNIEEVCSDFTLLKNSDCFADHLYVYEKLLYTHIIQKEKARMQDKNITQGIAAIRAPEITAKKIEALESLRVSIAQAQPPQNSITGSIYRMVDSKPICNGAATHFGRKPKIIPPLICQSSYAMVSVRPTTSQINLS